MPEGEGKIEAFVRGILWGCQVLHVRDGVTGSRFFRGDKWGKRGLTALSAVRTFVVASRLGGGGSSGVVISSGREVVS
jgi:hypothetical protein